MRCVEERTGVLVARGQMPDDMPERRIMSQFWRKTAPGRGLGSMPITTLGSSVIITRIRELNEGVRWAWGIREAPAGALYYDRQMLVELTQSH